MKRSKPAEHRWSGRQPMQLRVTLSGGRQRPQPAVCHNLGLGGMYVETNPQWLLLNSLLDVGFTIRSEDGESRHRLPVRVVRVSQNGAGLMFSNFKPDAAGALGELLYGRPARANASASGGGEWVPRAAQGA